MTQHPELLPCPFCGGFPLFMPGVYDGEIEYTHKCIMGCVKNRGEWGAIWKSEAKAAKEWNRAVRAAITAWNKRQRSE